MNDMNIFFKNKDGQICYNEKCQNCNFSCKQSYRAVIVNCPKTKKEKKRK